MTAVFAGEVPATPAQQRLWLVHQQGPRGIEFSFPYLFAVRGRCAVDRLADAIGAVVARHTPLRTTFSLANDVLTQHVHPPAADFFTHQRVPDAGEAAELIADEVATPFDLATDWPIRVRLYQIRDEEFLLLFNVHHIATDGLSMQIMLDEIGTFYRGESPAELGSSYAQRRFADREPAPEAVAFWQEMVTDAPAAVRLPTARHRRRRQSFSGRWVDRDVPAAQVDRLDRIARSAGASVYSALFGLLAVTLGRRTGTDEVVLGVPFAGRHGDEESLVGFFVNLLPVQFGVDESMTFEELFAAAGEAVTAALENSHVPLDRIMAGSGGRGLSGLLNVTLTEEQTPRLDLAGLQVDNRDLRLDVARYHMAFDYRHVEGGLRFEVSYAKDELNRADVTAVLDDLAALIVAACGDPGTRLATLAATAGAGCVLDDPEPVAAEESLAACWQATVTAHGADPAVVDRSGVLTFAELDALSRTLADLLRGNCIRPGDPVAVRCSRTRDFFVAVLGILRFGATPVLLDAGHPKARLTALIEQAGAVWTAGSAGLEIGPTIVVPSTSADATDSWATRPLDGMAYTIYTSGSTGKPKCVGVRDSGVLRLLANLSSLGLAGPGQRLALNASFGFDASVQQWIRLFTGSTVVVLDETTRLDPVLLTATVLAERVTELDISPRHLEAVLDVLLDGLDQARLRLLVGGEAISPDLWARLRAADNLVAWNMYGPTECTVDATVFPLALSPDPTIGLPLPAVRAYVLDQWLRPVPPGAPGMLYLAGPGLARGYLGAAGRTAAAFVPDPIAGGGGRMYRTGDRVRMRADGCLDYLGRADDQVKISGYRVERGEIEHAVLTQPGVSACAVVIDTESVDPAPHLYVVCDQDVLDALPARLGEVLPAYLVPRRFTRVERIPLTTRGKIDREQLRTAPPPAAPVTGAAQMIADVWQTVLGRTGIQPDDDFFSLGGHSLLAIRVVARLRRDMNVTLPISTVFDYPVLRDLAEHVEKQLRAKT